MVGQLHTSATLLPGKQPVTHQTGGYVGAPAGLEAVGTENLCICLESNTGSPGRSSAPHRLPGADSINRLIRKKSSCLAPVKHSAGHRRAGTTQRLSWHKNPDTVYACRPSANTSTVGKYATSHKCCPVSTNILQLSVRTSQRGSFTASKSRQLRPQGAKDGVVLTESKAVL
jgi:hypothetical protein